jgi:hypothetical protein
VSQAGQDYEAQRVLEQHALRNVSWLAEKLGYRDSIDRKVERRLAVGMIAFTVVTLAVLVTGILTSETPADEMAMRRCKVQVRAEETMDMRARIFREHPEMTSAQREAALQKSMGTFADERCPAPVRK